MRNRFTKHRAAILVLVACFVLAGFSVLPIRPLSWLSRKFDTSEVVEYVPHLILADSNAPPIKAYAAEFAAKREQLKKLRANAAPAPETNAAFQGRIFFAHSNTSCGTTLIQTYTGANWTEGQKQYLQSNVAELKELTVFQDKVVSEAWLLTNSSCSDWFILATTWKDERQWQSRNNVWGGSVWRFTPQTSNLTHVTTGHSLALSPDLTVGLLMRGNRDGFHSFHLFHARTGEVENLISMWESDPQSGTSWDYLWSEDSNAIMLVGDTSGYDYDRRSGRLSFKLIYVLSEKKMYSLPAPKPYYLE